MEKGIKTVCPDCEGQQEQMSECCGALIDSYILICSQCKEHSDISVCETCNGTGEIEQPNNEERKQAP